MVLRCYRWSVLFRVRVARRAVRFAVCERLGPEAPVAARRVHGRLVVPCEASRDGRVELPILPKPDLSRARLTKHETNSRRTAAYRSQIDGAELARTTTTARTPAVATAPRTRSAAAQNRLHSARAAFWRRRGTRGLERHETAHADAADAYENKKVTARPPQVSNPNHCYHKTIVVVPKASCVGSTAINH